MSRAAVYLLLALAVAACKTIEPSQSAKPIADTRSVVQLAAAIADDAKRVDADKNAAVRAQSTADASRDAAACMAQAPRAVACLYGRALALGLEARLHPTRAGELLDAMLGSLTDAEAADPTYDEAGPARVRALVLVRAPGWPIGPGDPDGGLAAARRAVATRPQYPPNQLALAEALAKTGDAVAAQRAYQAARDSAQALTGGSDREAWLREADAGLLRP